MKILKSLIFFVFSLCIVHINYILVVPKYYDYYEWRFNNVRELIFMGIAWCLFLIAYYWTSRNRFNSILYYLTIIVMLVYNVHLFLVMNPINKEDLATYIGTKWATHSPEPFYIFLISLFFILSLIPIKLILDKFIRKQENANH
jgi:hypothetical protein